MLGSLIRCLKFHFSCVGTDDEEFVVVVIISAFNF